MLILRTVHTDVNFYQSKYCIYRLQHQRGYFLPVYANLVLRSCIYLDYLRISSHKHIWDSTGFPSTCILILIISFSATISVYLIWSFKWCHVRSISKSLQNSQIFHNFTASCDIVIVLKAKSSFSFLSIVLSALLISLSFYINNWNRLYVCMSYLML